MSPGVSIGVVTPYTGGNFGDRAILAATIGALRDRCPDVAVLGFVLYPDRVSRVHGIPCAPVSARHGSFYRVPSEARSDPTSAEGAGDRTGGRPSSLRDRLVGLVKQVPALHAAAKRVRDGAVQLRDDLRHWIATYRRVRDLDMLVVAGGGQFDDEWGGPWGHPYSLWKFTRIADFAGVPTVFCSVGVCRLAHRRSRRFVRAALRSAAYVSVRDEGSLDLLAEADCPADHAVVPDLAFAWDHDVSPDTIRTEAVRSGEPDTATVAVSPIAFGDPRYWPSTLRDVARDYQTSLTDFVAEQTSQGREVRLFATCTSDFEVTSEVFGRLPASARKRVRPFDPESDLSDVLDVIAAADVVVASRLHGVILSHLLRKPTLAVSYDRKVDAHMRDLRQERHSVDIAEVDAGDLCMRLERLMDSRESISAEIDREARDRRRRVESQFDRVLGILEGSSGSFPGDLDATAPVVSSGEGPGGRGGR